MTTARPKCASLGPGGPLLFMPSLGPRSRATGLACLLHPGLCPLVTQGCQCRSALRSVYQVLAWGHFLCQFRALPCVPEASVFYQLPQSCFQAWTTCFDAGSRTRTHTAVLTGVCVCARTHACVFIQVCFQVFSSHGPLLPAPSTCRIFLASGRGDKARVLAECVIVHHGPL